MNKFKIGTGIAVETNFSPFCTKLNTFVKAIPASFKFPFMACTDAKFTNRIIF